MYNTPNAVRTTTVPNAITTGITTYGDQFGTYADPSSKFFSGQFTKATSTNPKDLLGMKKVDMFAVPPVAIAHESCAMMDGEWKYGFRNWREKEVRARIYIAAAMRHLMAWAEGQETAEDSGVHHLGHARACLAILLDAQATGNLVDDRSKGEYSNVLEELSEWVKERSKHYAEKAES